jgi:hypothetical protein
VLDLALNVGKDLSRIGLIPASVQVLRGKAELDNEVAGEVLWLNLTPLLPPQPQKGGLIAAHNDPGIRAADECLSIGKKDSFLTICRHDSIPSEFRNDA